MKPIIVNLETRKSHIYKFDLYSNKECKSVLKHGDDITLLQNRIANTGAGKKLYMTEFGIVKEVFTERASFVEMSQEISVLKCCNKVAQQDHCNDDYAQRGNGESSDDFKTETVSQEGRNCFLRTTALPCSGVHNNDKGCAIDPCAKGKPCGSRHRSLSLQYNSRLSSEFREPVQNISTYDEGYTAKQLVQAGHKAAKYVTMAVGNLNNEGPGRTVLCLGMLISTTTARLIWDPGSHVKALNALLSSTPLMPRSSVVSLIIRSIRIHIVMVTYGRGIKLSTSSYHGEELNWNSSPMESIDEQMTQVVNIFHKLKGEVKGGNITKFNINGSLTLIIWFNEWTGNSYSALHTNRVWTWLISQSIIALAYALSSLSENNRHCSREKGLNLIRPWILEVDRVLWEGVESLTFRAIGESSCHLTKSCGGIIPEHGECLETYVSKAIMIGWHLTQGPWNAFRPAVHKDLTGYYSLEVFWKLTVPGTLKKAFWSGQSIKAGSSSLSMSLTQRDEFNVLVVVDNGSTGHMWLTTDDKQPASALAVPCICWSATVFVYSTDNSYSDCRLREANMRSILQESSLHDICKGCRECLVEDPRSIGGTLANIHIKVISGRVAVALQRLQDVIRRKDSVFFILSSGSDALSKSLLPFFEAQDVLQLSRTIVERGCMAMGYTGWLHINPSTLCKNEYSMAARLGAHLHGTRNSLERRCTQHVRSIRHSY